MEVTVSIGMDTLNDGDFDERDDYYKSDDEFFNRMREDIEMNSDVAYEVVNNLGHFILKFFLFREIVRKVLLKDFRLVFQGLRFFGYQEGFDAARQNIGFLFDKLEKCGYNQHKVRKRLFCTFGIIMYFFQKEVM